MKSIDAKSMIIGLLAGFCLMLVMGQGGAGYGGRYQLDMGGSDRDMAFILDTHNGKLWHRQYSTFRSYGSPRKPKHEHRDLGQTLIQPKPQPAQPDVPPNQ